MSIVIIDHGLANIHSVVNMLKYLNFYPKVIHNPKDLKDSDKIILPGIGSAAAVWNNLNETGFTDPLRECIEIQKKPILGICVGMQLMTEGSEEGNTLGFGWIKGRCVRFRPVKTNPIKVPHMSWNKVLPQQGQRLFGSLTDPQKFYFVHSYYVQCDNKENISALCHYGHDFVAAVEAENIFGVQFHPEKSHKYGMRLFQNFLNV
ncbi:MAG: imidazole glycerol phosphate synthase subunit HisH [Alphaproteobacteria bacterium]|jgi:glutamine amidotransferase|nr:imidazole glycerol phosphate synthase subunit HisH [Alphaproteobacteria bacterium]MBP9776934.1 imidazole glycerol phosphate synthase subunit HisH [Alphaproteobacteria bacterium]